MSKKYCTWRNYTCSSYLCCSFCKKENCPDRCKDNPEKCRYCLEVEPLPAGNNFIKKESKEKEVETKAIEKPVVSDQMTKEEAKRLARKLRREARKKRLQNGNS